MFKVYRQLLMTISIGLAIICGLFYTRYVYYDFVLSLSYFAKFNVPSVAYTILRAVTILFPLILITPISKSLVRLGKLRIMFFIMGICYLLGNTWVFYYLAQNPFSALFDIEQLVITQKANALTLNYLVWNCYTLWSVLFSTIQGLLYLALAIKIGDNRKTALTLYGIAALASILIPILYFCFDPTSKLIAWARKDTPLLLSQALTWFMLFVAGSSPREWDSFLLHC